MRSVTRVAPGPMVRAGLLLPLLAGVLAMHVLLLCSDGAGEAAHAGHATVSTPVPGHAATHATGHAAALAASVVSGATGPVVGPASTTAVVCVAVLGAVVALVLRRRGALGPPAAPVPGSRATVHRRLARPPPPVPLGLLLCVSRT